MIYSPSYSASLQKLECLILLCFVRRQIQAFLSDFLLTLTSIFVRYATLFLHDELSFLLFAFASKSQSCELFFVLFCYQLSHLCAGLTASTYSNRVFSSTFGSMCYFFKVWVSVLGIVVCAYSNSFYTHSMKPRLTTFVQHDQLLKLDYLYCYPILVMSNTFCPF